MRTSRIFASGYESGWVYVRHPRSRLHRETQSFVKIFRQHVPCVSRNAHCVSLRGGLLRLMMAGCVYVAIGPTGFWLGFVVSEIIALLSSIGKEGLLMVKKASSEVMAYAKRIERRVIASWEAHLPSRQSLLTSL